MTISELTLTIDDKPLQDQRPEQHFSPCVVGGFLPAELERELACRLLTAR